MWHDPNFFSGNINDNDGQTGLLRPKRLDNWSRAMVATWTRNVESVKSFFFLLNLPGENVDQVLDNSAGVAAAGRRGGGQGLDEGRGGGRRWRRARCRRGRRVRGRVSAKQAEAKEAALRGCRDDAEKGKKAQQMHFGGFFDFWTATKVLKRDPRFKYI